MNSEKFDYLWDPTAPIEADVQALERQLGTLGASARGLDQRPTPHAPMPAARRQGRHFATWAMAAAAMLLLTVLPALQRWSWPAQAAWPLQLTQAAQTRALALAPGQTLQLAEDQTAHIEVARIGHIELAPGSRLQLIETQTGRHRVALDYGRLKARVWAPPGHFGVLGGGALVLDLGCEFDLSIDELEQGRLQVSSGWVAFERGGRETLVPEHHVIRFDHARNSTPLRIDASPQLRSALAALEERLLTLPQPSPAEIQRAADVLAGNVEDADRHTLLILLTRYPVLAETALYPRLGRALDLPIADRQHRAAWATGDRAAIDAWWQHVPKPPKAWWRNWRDAF